MRVKMRSKRMKDIEMGIVVLQLLPFERFIFYFLVRENKDGSSASA